MGSDAVGLVGRITAPIAEASGNILDLRQDVLHGLFTIYMVVELTESMLDRAGLEDLMGQVGAETGLSMSVDGFEAVARHPDKKSLLMIIIGKDRPGIIGTSSEMLGKYGVNIELAEAIGREGVFLMEFLTDISHARIPLENLKRTISKNMEALNIKTVFQDSDVFNKKKRVVLFNITSSFIRPEMLDELLEQAEIPAEELGALYSREQVLPSLRAAIAKLDNLPLSVLECVLTSVTPTAGTTELLQTLKTMGYKAALATTGFSFFADHARSIFGLDHAYGIGHDIDHDARTVVGTLNTDAPGAQDIDAVLSQIADSEGLDCDDITIVTDDGCRDTPGIRVDIDLNVWLDAWNQRILSRDNLLGLLGCFGIPS